MWRKSEAVGARTRDLRIKSPLLYRLSYSLKLLQVKLLRPMLEAFGIQLTTPWIPVTQMPNPVLMATSESSLDLFGRAGNASF